VGSGPDADGRDREHLGDLGRRVLLDEFEDDRETSCLLQTEGFFLELFAGKVAASLDFVAADLVDRLRGEPDVAHDGDPGLDDGRDAFAELVYRTLEFDRLRAAFRHETSRVADGLLGVELVREERHIADDHGVLDGAGYHRGVVDHLVHGHAEGIVVALNDRTQGIAHENGIYAALIEELRGGVIVRGENGDLVSRFFAFAKSRSTNAWHH